MGTWSILERTKISTSPPQKSFLFNLAQYLHHKANLHECAILQLLILLPACIMLSSNWLLSLWTSSLFALMQGMESDRLHTSYYLCFSQRKKKSCALPLFLHYQNSEGWVLICCPSRYKLEEHLTLPSLHQTFRQSNPLLGKSLLEWSLDRVHHALPFGVHRQPPLLYLRKCRILDYESFLLPESQSDWISYGQFR